MLIKRYLLDTPIIYTKNKYDAMQHMKLLFMIIVNFALIF